MAVRPEFEVHRQEVLAAMKARPNMSDEEVVGLWFGATETAEINREALLQRFRINCRQLKAQGKIKGERVTGELLRRLKRELIGRVWANLQNDFGMTETQALLYLHRVGVVNRQGKIAKEFGGES